MGKEFWGSEYLITMMTDSFVYIQNYVTPEILLRDWTFLDGEPCGVERVDLSEESTH